MKIKLQENVPYHQAVFWQIHDDCYRQGGIRLWSQKHIPFNVTSNVAAARQNAEVVFALLEEGFPEADTIPILETGAGQGLFAYHFLTAMEAICRREGRDYFARLRYWLTDYADATLADLAQNPCFDSFRRQGVLEFYQLDARQPDAARTRDGRAVTLAPESFVAMIGNYQHSILPVSVLVCREGEFYEKHVDIYYWLNGRPDQPDALAPAQDILQQICAQLEKFDFSRFPAGNSLSQVLFQCLDQTFHKALLHLRHHLMGQPDLQELDIRDYLETLLLEQLQLEPESCGQADTFPRERLLQMIQRSVLQPLFRFEAYELPRLESIPVYRPIALAGAVPDPAARSVLEAIRQQWPLATVSYPRASMACLEGLLAALRPGGILLISDKAHYQHAGREGLCDESPTLHGNTLSHPVNFPFLSQWLAQRQIASRHTRDETCRLQTMLIAKAPALPPWLQAVFRAQFEESNLNLVSNALLEQGQEYMQQQAWAEAISCLLAALQHRPGDAPALYLLALCYLYQERFTEVLTCLQQPHDDFFGAFDFDLVKAEAHRCLRHFSKAAACYRQSLERFGDSALTYFNLAGCLEQSGQAGEARLAYQRACELEPENEAIRLAWQEICQEPEGEPQY